MELRGKVALVTGASSGMGIDFARELAGRGADLVLVARRRDKLETVAAELRQRAGVQVHVMARDLVTERDALLADLDAAGLQIDVLVNNAGFGAFGEDLALPWERVQKMLDLDIVALFALTRIFSVHMVERGWGRILQVASVAAYQPTPTYAAYGAAKAFVLHYSEALDHELRGTGVTCTTLSPGVTATEFFDVAGQALTPYQRLVVMDSATVAAVGVRAMMRGQRSVVPGLLNKITAWSVRLIPRRLATWVAGLTMKAG